MKFYFSLARKTGRGPVAIQTDSSAVFPTDSVHQRSLRSFSVKCCKTQVTGALVAAEEAFVVRCEECSVAYSVSLIDPWGLFSSEEWDRRIDQIRTMVLEEHQSGHPSEAFINNGTLTPQTAQARGL